MPIKQSSFSYSVILAGISALPPLSIDMNLPAIPDIEAAFHLAKGQGSLTFSLFLLGFSMAPLLGGPLADRYGRRVTLLVALFVNTLAAFGCSLAGVFHFLLFSRFLQGIACGVCVLLPLAIVRDTYCGALARKKLSVIAFVGGVAPLVAPILGSWVLVFRGWAAIYGVQAGLGLALFCLVAWGIAETLPVDKRKALNLRGMAAGYKAIFTSPRFLAFSLALAFCFGCMFSYIAGSPGLMIGELHLSEQAYSLAFALTSCGVLVGALVSGILGRWEVHASRIIAVSLTCMTIIVAAIFCVTWLGLTALPLLLPLLFCVMGCFGLIMPNAMAEAVGPWGHMAGAASGAINSLQMLIGAGASAMPTLLAGFLPPGKAMGASMLCAVLFAAGCYVVLGRRGRSAARSSP